MNLAGLILTVTVIETRRKTTESIVLIKVSFEPMIFWCILLIISILISVNLIDINMCKVKLHETCFFCV